MLSSALVVIEEGKSRTIEIEIISHTLDLKKMYFKFSFLFAQLFPKFHWEESCIHMLTRQSIGFFLFLFPFNWSLSGVLILI